MPSLSHPGALFALFVALSASACLDPNAASGAAPAEQTSAEQTNPEAQQANRYATNGVVRGIDRDRLSVTIAHEDVPGYMPAMTMPFSLRSADQVDGLDVGDSVRFTFQPEAGGRHVLVEIAKR